MLLAVGLWTACSDQNDILDGVEENAGNAEAFISLNVVLPTSVSPGTRDGVGKPENDNFDDGSADEYEVKDLTVVVFDKATDDGVAQVVQPATWTYNGTVTTNLNITISSSALGAIEVGSNPTRYVLAIANANGQVTPKVGQTYGAIKAVLANKNKANFNTEGFFMSNSPIVMGSAVQVLAPCNPQRTEADAKLAANIATVYLERILGKVEVKHPTIPATPPASGWTATWTYTVPAPSSGTSLYTGDKVAFSAWGLDVTNTTTYPVRNVDANWIGYANGDAGTTSDATAAAAYPGNRFIGAATDPQRIYWAIDPNYKGTTDFTQFNKISTVANSLTTTSAVTIDYCLENTFDFTDQKQNQTTRVVMQANYTPSGGTAGTDFYRMSGVIYSQDNLFKFLEHKFGITGITAVGMTYGSTAVTESVKGAKITSITDGTTTINSTDAAYTALFNEIPNVDYYQGGVCYYVARIKHFGDVLTPWAYGATYTAKDHLGRYGVVRNNWYELTINKVDKGPGEPIIPVPTDTPDDEQTYYIDCTINILSWAKRTQGVDW